MKERLLNLGAHEEGFTIIEALVAATILTLGSLVVAVTFVTAIHSAQRTGESQFGISIAQREMEWVRAHEFAQIAIKTAPEESTPGQSGAASLQLSPLGRVLPGRARFSVNRAENRSNTTDFSNTMAFVDDIAEGFENTKEVKYLEGSVKEGEQVQATVYRFVLCEEESVLPENCNTKRIVIDVVPKVNAIERGRQRNYYELQSTVVNPIMRAGEQSS